MDGFLFHESVDGRTHGTEGRERARDVAIARERDDPGVAEVLRQTGRGAEKFDLRGLVRLFRGEHDREFAFGRGGDAGHHLDATDGVLARGGFARKHDRVGQFQDGIGDVGHLGAGRHRVLDHRLQHVRRDDDRLAGGDGHGDGLALDERQGLVGDFDAKVTAGHHEGVGGAENVAEVFDGRLVLDLRDDVGLGMMFEQQGAERVDVGCLAHEGQCVEVDPDLATDGHVGAVLVGEGREVDLDAGKVDVAAATERARLFHFTAEAVGLLFEHAQLDESVVDEDDAAHRHRVDHLGVIRRDDEDIPVGLRVGGASDVHELAGGQLGRFGPGAGPDFGTFDVHHHGQFLADLLADFTHPRDGGPDPGVVGVSHIQADHIGSGLDNRL